VTFVWFFVMVGVLVLVHELGHFLWAKAFGVRVLKFSIGFGPRVAGFRRGATEYVLSAFPLGGYVRMLGENPRDEVPAREAHTSFSGVSLFRRFVIVIGGPMMSLAFPIALYFVVFLGDTALTPSTIGRVFPNRPAGGKLLAGDRVVAIDGDEIATFYELSRIVENSTGRSLELSVDRRGKPLTVKVTPVASSKELPLEMSEEVGRIGIAPQHPLAVVGVASPTSPAAAAHLRSFDVIVAAAGKPIERFVDLQHVLEKNRGTLVPLTFLRPTPVASALGGLAVLEIYEPRVATLTPEPGEGDAMQRAGLESSDLYVSAVTAGSPEARVGLLPGDRLVELDGRPIAMWPTLLEDLRAARGREHTVSWMRGGELRQGRFALTRSSGVTEDGQGYDRYVVSMRNWLPAKLDEPVPNPSPLFYAGREAFRATSEVVELTVFSVVRLLQGRLSVKSIGGPLTIFDVAGTAAREGALNYLTLMALISINLGLINLLPIPLLDGGHVLFLLSEAVMRRPLGVRAREYAHVAGLVVLLAIMVLAFKNDIERQWPTIVEELSGE
jgi:regulator of sigma E protease